MIGIDVLFKVAHQAIGAVEVCRVYVFVPIASP